MRLYKFKKSQQVIRVTGTLFSKGFHLKITDPLMNPMITNKNVISKRKKSNKDKTVIIDK